MCTGDTYSCDSCDFSLEEKIIVVSKGGESFSCVDMLLGFYSFECVGISAVFGKSKGRVGNIITAKSSFWAQVACACHS